MILKRIVSNLRNQNWTSLTLELIVLIIGIYIGLQADAWNTERQENAEEQAIIKSLKVEVDSNIAIYGTALRDNNARQETYLNYYKYLMDKSSPRPEEEALLLGLCRVGVQVLLEYDNTIYDELVSTGRTGILSNSEVRLAIGKYVKLQIKWQKNYADVAPFIRDNFTEIHKFLTWAPILPNAENSGFTNCQVDFAALETNTRTVHYIAGVQRMAFIHLRGTYEIFQELKKVKATLEAGYPSSENKEGSTP